MAGHRALNNRYRGAQSAALWGHSGPTSILHSSMQNGESEATALKRNAGDSVGGEGGSVRGRGHSGHLALTPPPPRTQAPPRRRAARGPLGSTDGALTGVGGPRGTPPGLSTTPNEEGAVRFPTAPGARSGSGPAQGTASAGKQDMRDASPTATPCGSHGQLRGGWDEAPRRGQTLAALKRRPWVPSACAQLTPFPSVSQLSLCKHVNGFQLSRFLGSLD